MGGTWTAHKEPYYAQVSVRQAERDRNLFGYGVSVGKYTTVPHSVTNCVQIAISSFVDTQQPGDHLEHAMRWAEETISNDANDPCPTRLNVSGSASL